MTRASARLLLALAPIGGWLLLPGAGSALPSSGATYSSPIRTIRFSGYTWQVKVSRTPVGPGPNRFSAGTKDVWVDASGRLHLRIVKRNGRWYCSEVVNSNSLGHGSYSFTLAGRVDRLDRNAVLGLFTWNDSSPAYSHREIDIELSRWGDPAAANAQYVVQPWSKRGHEHRFYVGPTGGLSTYSFSWSRRAVRFSSRRGRPGALGRTFQAWTYAGAGVPPAGGENARINLWLMNGAPPSNSREVEIVVRSFRFVPER